MKALRFSLAMLLAFCTMALFAQQKNDKTSTQTKPSAKPAASMELPKPGPEMQKLSKMLVGNWTVHESHEAGEMMPAGSSTGTATYKLGPGGFSVVEDFSTSGSLGKFKGTGTFWWDPKQQVYRGVWCDSMTPTCDPGSTAKWEGEKLIAKGESEMPDGSKTYMREEYTDITPSSFTFIMYGGPNAESLKKFMTIKYTRAGAAKAKAKQ